MLTGRAAGLPGPDLADLMPVIRAFVDGLRPDKSGPDTDSDKPT